MKKTALSIAILALGGVAFSGAQAATITYSWAPIVEETTEINQNSGAALSLFDSTLGTLTQVDVNTAGSASTTINLTNNAQQPQLVEATSQVNLLFNSSVQAIPASTPNPLVISLPTGVQNIAAGATYTSPLLTGMAAGSTTFTGAGQLASFSAPGGGLLTVDCVSLSGLTVLGGGGNITATQSTTAGCAADVTYTYEPLTPPPSVPAPAPLVLMGLGLAGLAASRRRK